MSYLLRVYAGTTLTEHEVMPQRNYHVGKSGKDDLSIPGIAVEFTIEMGDKTWRGNSKDKLYREDNKLQSLVVQVYQQGHIYIMKCILEEQQIHIEWIHCNTQVIQV